MWQLLSKVAQESREQAPTLHLRNSEFRWTAAGQRDLGLVHEPRHQLDALPPRRRFYAAGNIDAVGAYGGDRLGNVVGREAAREDDWIVRERFTVSDNFVPIRGAAGAAKFARRVGIEKQCGGHTTLSLAPFQVRDEFWQLRAGRRPSADGKHFRQIGNEFRRLVAVQLNRVQSGRFNDLADFAVCDLRTRRLSSRLRQVR